VAVRQAGRPVWRRRNAGTGRRLNAPAPLDLRVNSIKATRDEVAAKLLEAPIAPSRRRIAAGPARAEKPALQNLPLFKERRDRSAGRRQPGAVAQIVGAKRGEMVVDFCAGAGGKTLALGATMRNTGRLYAFDVSEKRLAKLKPRLARSGLSNVHPVLIAHERDAKIKRLAGKIDRVLVDAPCRAWAPCAAIRTSSGARSRKPSPRCKRSRPRSWTAPRAC
jgi:16S rRNA (cytosine967-C5)-methyltransferase